MLALGVLYIHARESNGLMSKSAMTVAGIQASYGHDLKANIAKTEDLVREAAKQGAQVILP